MSGLARCLCWRDIRRNYGPYRLNSVYSLSLLDNSVFLSRVLMRRLFASRPFHRDGLLFSHAD